MALSGSLSDMGINDVLQLPFMGARTGELSLEREGKAARIFYEEGRIVHCQFGGLVDEDALVDLLGWVSGEFVFKQGLKAPQKTIQEDLHRLLMKVAKKRDEQLRKVSAPAAGAAKLSLESDDIRKTIQEAMAAHAGFVLTSFVTRDGRCLNAVPSDSAACAVAIEIAKQCFAVADAAARRGIKRCWLEYDEGHCLWLRLGSEVSLVIVAQAAAPMGAVMLAASKIGGGLKQLLETGESR